MNELPQKSPGIQKQLKRFSCGCEWEVAIQDGEIVGVNYEPENANIHCPKVWELICSGLTKGIFQLETPLGQTTAKACHPYGVEELSDVNAILRPGCISGDTLIIRRVFYNEEFKTVNGVPKYTYARKTMRHLYKHKAFCKEIASYNTDAGVLFNNTVNNIVYSGDKEVFRVVFDKGINTSYKMSTDYKYPHLMNLECTSDHKLLTPYGWKELKDFRNGDRFAFLRVHSKRGLGGYKGNFHKGEKGFRQNCWYHYEHKCIFCDWKEGSLDVNHIEGNRKINNHWDNLCFMCPNHHRLYCEAKISKEELIIAKNKLALPNMEDIVWVSFSRAESLGIKDTYDIQMEGPHHNFIAGNVIVHNCGDAELDGKTLKQRYVDRKNGLENPEPLHPKLGNLLESTQNIGVYQESYLTISRELAGFTGEESVAFLKCLSGDSILMTRSGPQKIKDLYKNGRAQVLSVNNNGKHEYVKLTKVWKSGVKKVFRVWTNKGFFIDCTEDHQLFTQNGWKQVKDINLHQDFLAITNSYITSTKKNAINENLSILLSYVISEGSYVKNTITIVNKNEWVINKLKNILNVEFGEDSYKTYLHKTTGCTTLLLRKHSAAFVKKYLKPAKSRYKKIPNVITKNLKCVITAFIGSYFNAEGSVGNHNIDFSSTSFDIIRTIQVLLLKYNIHSSIYIKNGIYNGLPYQSYKLYVSDPHDIYRFRNIFKDYIQEDKLLKMQTINSKEYSNSRFLVPSGYMRAISNSIQDMNSILGTPDGTIYGKNITYDKAHRYQQFLKSELLQEILDADYKFTKVTQIEELKEEEVYDFSVDGETHCCFVNGILTHNCVSKKQTDKMSMFKNKFINGCVTHSNLSEEEANDIFDVMEAGQRYAFNKCLDKRTKVQTLKGDKELQDLIIGDFVLNEEGKYVKVLDIYLNGVRKTFLYKFNSGKELRCTPDHKILAGELIKIDEVFKNKLDVGGDFIINRSNPESINTMDIEVDSDSHIFIANGIPVSNSHSISYALDALYFSAYQKAHFPRAFFLAELTYAKNIEEIGEVIDDSLNFKIDICKPDLRLKNAEFTLTNKCIQYGLGRIKGVGESKLNKLLKYIGESDIGKMSWLQLMDALSKTGSDAATALIYSGAVDFTLLTRTRMLFELTIFSKLNEKQQNYVLESNSLLSGLTGIVEMGSGKNTLCSSKATLKKMDTLLNELKSPPKSLQDSRNQIFDWEINYLGYAFTTSEIDESLSNCTCDDFNSGKSLKEYIIGGTIVRIKVIETKGKEPGQEMAFIEFKDSTNKVSGVAFPQVWLENRVKIFEGNKLMFFGKVGKKNSFIIDRVMQL